MTSASQSPHQYAQHFERRLIAQMLRAPEMTPRVLEILTSRDLIDLTSSAIFRAILDVLSIGATVDLLSIGNELDRGGKFATIGGPATLAEIYDLEASSALILDTARSVRRQSVERQIRALHQSALGNGALIECSQKIGPLLETLSDLTGAGSRPENAILIGETLEAIRKRPEQISPFPGYLPPEPALIVLNAQPKTGKSTFAGYLAQCWGSGISPWEGAPDLPGTRALIISAEQPATRVDRTLCRMDTASPDLIRDTWTARCGLVARDPDLPKQIKPLLILDGTGRALLRKLLLNAISSSDPFGFVLLDSLSRLAPGGFDENSNADMTAFLHPLQELAEETCTYLILIHHTGHSERAEARTAGRGASALGAVAQAIWLLENVAENPRHRRLHIQGNAIAESRQEFAVCSEESEPGYILYFRPHNPLEGYDASDYLDPGEEISTTDLAARLQDIPPLEGERPDAKSQRLASALRHKWESSGEITTEKGPRNSLIMRLLTL